MTNLVEALEKTDDVKVELFHGETYYFTNPEFAKSLPEKLPEELRRYNAEVIEHYGGEGEGDTYYSVVKFTDKISGEVTFIKFDGWYASYVGAELERIFEVTPQQKTITVYE